MVTDLVSHSALTSRAMQQALKAMEERGMGWRFGMDDPGALFAQHGWEAEVKHREEEGAKYDSQRFPRHGGGATSFSLWHGKDEMERCKGLSQAAASSIPAHCVCQSQATYSWAIHCLPCATARTASIM